MASHKHKTKDNTAPAPASRSKVIPVSVLLAKEPKPYCLSLIAIKRGKEHTANDTWHGSIAKAKSHAMSHIGQYKYVISRADGSIEPIIGMVFNRGMAPADIRLPNKSRKPKKSRKAQGSGDGTTSRIYHNDKGSLPVSDYEVISELSDGSIFKEIRKGFSVVRGKIVRKKRTISFKVNREMVTIEHKMAQGLYDHCPICFRDKSEPEQPLGKRVYHRKSFKETIESDGYGESYAMPSDIAKRQAKASKEPLGLEYKAQRASITANLTGASISKPHARNLARKMGMPVDTHRSRFIADGGFNLCVVDMTEPLQSPRARYYQQRHENRLKARLIAFERIIRLRLRLMYRAGYLEPLN